MKRSYRVILLSGVVMLLLSTTAYGQAVFLARKAVGAVSRLTSSAQGYDVATVLLAADADKVYKTSLDILQDSPKLRITSSDTATRTIEFTDGNQAASLKVSRIQEDMTQLIVGSSVTAGKKAMTPLVVDGIFRVCKKMGVSCTLADN